MTTLLRHIVFMRNVFCFNGFNQTAIVLRYSDHIKPRKTIKTIKPENITHKHKRNSVVIKHCVLLGRGLQNKGEVAGIILLLCIIHFLL